MWPLKLERKGKSKVFQASKWVSMKMSIKEVISIRATVGTKEKNCIGCLKFIPGK